MATSVPYWTKLASRHVMPTASASQAFGVNNTLVHVSQKAMFLSNHVAQTVLACRGKSASQNESASKAVTQTTSVTTASSVI